MSLELRVVLVEPMYQGNVGSVARAMKNFGQTDLVLVNPCKLEGQARAMSSHARDVLEGARKVHTLKEAVEGANLTIGTTGASSKKNGEHVRLPLYTPPDIKEKLKGYSGKIALLFGREDNGFRNDELKSFDMLVTIPTSDVYPIMNLSHAVAVLLYELSELEGGKTPLAEDFDLHLLYEHMDKFLEEIEYPPHKKEKTRLMLRRIYGRAGLTPREVQTLRGLLRKGERKLRSSEEESSFLSEN
ncbi:MAG: RNA methyltransferase [Methanosarcinaceae archaeon]|nr:RNA methyltransferase [Methanosarcinaceae archaeon]MDD4330769.1 RNA methyltransferase [Methanosarcinaceae archaeon]MDD4748540.1 RNA methyltransferase [Methanosarcinaceae archaeon]